MEPTIGTQITEFLSETEIYVEALDGLSFDAAADFCDMLDELIAVATAHITEIDPELRVRLCSTHDMVLERIVDTLPPFTKVGDQLGVYSPATTVEYRTWKNAELMKDCGLAGYMLAKEIGGKSTMYFGERPSDYSYLADLSGLEMLYSREADMEQEYNSHLVAEHEKMDVLIIYGMYLRSLEYLNNYRNLRPDGKVYCGLDMNSVWLENIADWGKPYIKKFTEQCDVLATSCRAMRDTLNRRVDVKFPCRWITNGFYNPKNIPTVADHNVKENVILTVGRLGTKDKNNEELLECFAKAAESKVLDGWTLRLAGSIDPQFEPFKKAFFEKYPNMKERVIFTGLLTDKAELYSEYAKAKIFALTSPIEGGTPNVFAEALFHGCMFITSNVDGADDITNYGQLGAKYNCGDKSALVKRIEETCKKATKHELQRHIPKALEYATRYYDWSRNAKKLAYLLFK